MASLAAEEKVEFLLQVLATSTDFAPDYAALAKKTGINTNANAQRKLKGIVEADKRFVLQSQKGGTKVIDKTDSDTVGTSSPAATPKQRKRAKDKENGDHEEGTPSKKSRTSQLEYAEADTLKHAVHDGNDDGDAI